MKSTDNLIKEANSFLESEKYRETIDLLCDEVLDKQKNAELFFCRSWAHHGLGEKKQAEKYKQKSLEIDALLKDRILDVGNYWFNDVGDYNKAIFEYDKCLFLDEDFAIAYYNTGLARDRLGDTESAINLFNKTISLTSDYANAYLSRGLVYYYKKLYDKAIEDFEKVIEINPDETDAYLNRGLSLYYKGEYDKAITDYNKVIEKDENYTIAYNNRGLAFHYKGEYKKAISDYDKALALDPEYKNAYINRGITYYRKGQYNEAIQDYKVALKFDNKLDYLYNNIGLAYYNKGYYKDAIKNYNRALELFPEYADALNNRGMVWYELGEYDKAIEDYTKAIEFLENYADAYNNRGNAWYFKQELDKADADFKKVAEYIGYEAIGFCNQGDVFSAKGEFHKASDLYTMSKNFQDIPDWLIEKIDQHAERNQKSINLLKVNVPDSSIIQSINLEDQLIKTLDNIRKVAKSDTKSVVHYTKLFVAEIYVSSLESRMHYSNAIYMNDPMEGQVFFEYLNDPKIIQAYLNGEKRNESSVYLGSFLPAEDSHQGKSHEDELVMWRTYGKDVSGKEAAGCNLVLSSEFFKEIKKPVSDEQKKSDIKENIQEVASIKEDYTKNKSGDEELLNVIYVDLHDDQKKIRNDNTGNLEPTLKELKSILNDLTILRNLSENHNDFKDNIDNTIFKHLSKISFLFKSADYYFENEVRVIKYIPRDSNAIKFLQVDEPHVPKKRFYIESNNEILPFIKKIHLGPKVINHQQWSLYFDFEIRQRAKELVRMQIPLYELNPSEIEISKSDCKFQ